MTGDDEMRDQRLHDVHNFCPSSFVSFWQCMNETLKGCRFVLFCANRVASRRVWLFTTQYGLGWSSFVGADFRFNQPWELVRTRSKEMGKGEIWSGRSCCSLPQSERCQQACIAASSRKDVIQNCRHSDELAFFTCLDRQQVGEECCNTAQTEDCKTACRAIFRSELTPSRSVRATVMNTCSENSPRTMACVNNFTRAAPVNNPTTFLHCCEKAASAECRESCRHSLSTKSTDKEIIDAIEAGGCGPPLLQDKLWQCFLQGKETVSTVEVSRIDRMGIDSAKLHCCAKAKSAPCRRLCTKTFSNEWTRLWEDFNNECLTQLTEDSLLHCLDEVEEPCELGCDGLSYCTNFNNRPTELFRSCSTQADDAARYDVALWAQQGHLSLPGLHIPIRNISHCSPLSWKAVACTLQIKPCHRDSHVNRICRDDCFKLLSNCMDWTHVDADTSAASLCSHLSPDDPSTPCISLAPFLEPSDHPYHSPRDQVTQPCKGDPCNASHVCSINRYCQQTSRACQPYNCALGCKMGEVSQYVVPAGSYVRIPFSTSEKRCLKICQCSTQGIIEKCQTMPCFPLDPCWVAGKKIDHGTSFTRECNLCACYAGEMICTRKQCEVSPLGMRDLAYTSLPCNCPLHYIPVCGKNGNTYPNPCLAKCAGLQDADFEYGPCESKDPCANSPCGPSQSCVPARRVCLSLIHAPCQQFQCVSLQDACNNLAHDPVCDTDGHDHPNICYLMRYGKTLAYHGHCIYGCNRTGPVCGIDGNTYSSECSALARHITIDYRGMCLAVGLIGDLPQAQCSEIVKCPPLARPGCLGVTPPGACCPICAGALRVLYSQKQVDRALYSLRGRGMNALTLSAILKALDRQIQVAECTVQGYLTVENDIMVLVVPVNERVSDLQLESCVREAEKLANLIERSSPRILSELSLSALITATVVHTTVSNSAAVPTVTLTVNTLIPALFLLLRWLNSVT